MTLIRRNPFARAELHREQVPNRMGGCPWCGMTNSNGKLYQYRVEHDDGSVYPDEKAFCSLDCREAYHA
jgi:hypothetical protein